MIQNKLGKSSQGFTLIELVCVIVLLGILSASAAPKFMSLQRDARVASLKAMAGAVKSAASLAGSKNYIAGGGACYVYDSKVRTTAVSALSNAKNLKCGIKDTKGNPHVAETIFGVPTSRGLGIVYALDGMSAETENKSYGNINKSSNYKRNGTVKCSELGDGSTDYCFLWINTNINGAPEDDVNGEGKILLGNKNSFVKINNTGSVGRDKYDPAGSCILEYAVTVLDSAGKPVKAANAANAVSAHYRVNLITEGC